MTGTIQRILAEAPFDVFLLARDLASGAEVAHRADEQVPAASTIKVPILAAAAAEVERGTMTWDDEVALGPEDLAVPGSGVLARCRPPVRFSRYNLAALMIIVSDNVATNWWIRELGYDAVNDLCRRSGCPGTELHRLMQGKPAQPGQRENLTTMADQARFYELLHRGELVSPAASETMLAILQGQQLITRIPRYLDRVDQVEVAHKTGTIQGSALDAGLIRLSDGSEPLVFAAAVCGWRHRAEADELIARLAFEVVRAFRPHAVQA